jgi:hypothetical protein
MRKLLLVVLGFMFFNVNAQVCLVPSSSSPFLAGYNPNALTDGNFNSDSYLDLVVTNSGSNNISVLFGNGAGSFTAPVNFATGFYPASVTSADFNTDGYSDVAVANFSSNDISILLGNGAGSFSAAVSFGVGTSPISITNGDFNADGKIDLGVANYGSNNISVLLGNGVGSFGIAINYAVGTNPYSLVSADFNADGKADIAVANYGNNTLSVLLDNGSGSFNPAVNFSVGAGPVSVTNTDFNADGIVDLAVANGNSNNVSVLLGSGSGSFNTAVNFAAGIGPVSVASSDFNSDGKTDLLVTNVTSSNVSLLLGNGTGNFASAVTFVVGTNPYAAIISDFNLDGKTDLATANYNSNDVSVLLNGSGPIVTINATATVVCSGTSIILTGGGATSYMWSNGVTDGVAFIPPVGSTTYTLIGTDTNGCVSNATKLITVNNLPTVSANASASVVCTGVSIVLTGGGATTYTWTGGVSNGIAFVPPTGNTNYTVSGTNASGCTNIAIKAITVNVLPIIVASTSNTMLCAGQTATLSASGASTYTWSTTANTTSIIVTPTVATTYTVNGTDSNGCINFAVVTQSIGGCLNPQPICFNTLNPLSFLTGTGPVFAVNADFNADGITDLVMANQGSANISVLLGTGTGSFSPAVNFAVGNGPSSLTSADFNADGMIDLAVTNMNSSSVGILLGDGTGSFTSAFGYTVPSNPFSVISADFNSDGKADLATANGGGYNVSVSLGSGTGTFSPAVNFAVGADPRSLTSADFNADGKVDLAVANLSNNNVSILLGTGTGNFSAAVNFAVGTGPIAIINGDFNKDGKTDLALANQLNNTASVLYGNGVGGFAPAMNLALGNSPSSITTTDFNNDGSPDLAITNLSDNNVSVLLGNGIGNFNSSINYTVAAGPFFVTTADFNTDSRADLAITNANNQIVVLLNLTPSVSANTTANNACTGTSIILTGGGATTYTWSGGVINGTTFFPAAGSNIYTVTGTNFNCYNTQTVTVTVDNTCADVWPGDANSDGIADNLDVLELGLHYTQTGTPRATTSNLWQSYYAANWSGTITNGKNVNHSNCNGDGIINDDDTLAIFNNYGSTHAFKPEQATTNSVLAIAPDQSSVAKGTWGTSSIYLGDATTSINNINGIAYTVSYDNTLLEMDSVWIEYLTSFINVSNQNLKFRKRDFGNGKLYTATTHTISGNVSGNGKIATLHYKIKSSLTTDNVLNLSIAQANQSDSSGVITPLTAGSATLMAIGASVGLNELTNGNYVSLHPNPTNGALIINSTTELQKVEVMAITGQLLMSEVPASTSHVLHLDHLANGVYFVNLYQNNRIVKREKIILNK